MTEPRLRALVSILVGAIAALAFLVSFRAISQFAVTTGAFPHSLGWAAPLLVDSFTLAASIEVLRSALAGQRAVYPWCLVAGSTARLGRPQRRPRPRPSGRPGGRRHPPGGAAVGPGAADARRPPLPGRPGGGQRPGAGHRSGTAAGLADGQPVHPPDRAGGGRAAGRFPLPRRGAVAAGTRCPATASEASSHDRPPGPQPGWRARHARGADRPRLRRRAREPRTPDADRPVACWTGCHPAAAPVKGALARSASLRDRLRRPLTRPSPRRPGETRSPGAGEEQVPDQQARRSRYRGGPAPGTPRPPAPADPPRRGRRHACRLDAEEGRMRGRGGGSGGAGPERGTQGPHREGGRREERD